MVKIFYGSLSVGERYSALDIDVESSTEKKIYSEPYISSERKIKEEIKTLTDDEKKQKLMIFYHSDGYCYHLPITESEAILRLSLTGQTNICASCNKIIKKSMFCAVYRREGTKWIELWKTNSFSNNKTPMFLNLHTLTQHLHKVFDQFTIQLGELRENEYSAFRAICWQITTNNGNVYYIPWHNGCLLPALPEYMFTIKNIKMLNQCTYKTLRFAENHDAPFKNTYRLTCC